jgi:alanine racemase
MQKTLSKISLSAIRQNTLKVLSYLHGKKLYAVVKADAYGHGAVEVSSAIEDIVDGFCVAIIDEGVALRICGITKPILVLAPPLSKDDILKAEMYNLTVTVNSRDTAERVGDLPCHIKINTGMNRYGCNINELDDILNALTSSQIRGVYSHLYAPYDDKISRIQLDVFKIAESKVKEKNKNAIAHIAASGGILKGGDTLCDCARCGIMLYGYTPEGFEMQGQTYGLKQELIPALKVYAPLVQQTAVFGEGAGYNKLTKKCDSLCTYRLGYADGFLRGVPLGVGNLCMDAFVAEKDAFNAQNGGHKDKITYNGQTFICVLDDAAAYARIAHTISYEVLCKVTARSLKIYER